MIETWLPVGGYEGIYEVSDLGRVRSLDRIIVINSKRGPFDRRVAGVILRPGPVESGHLTVSLNKGGVATTEQVHTLVLEAFVGPRPGSSQEWHGCHGDGEPSNNRLTNLRWDTRSGNENDKVVHGRSNRGSRNRACKLSEGQAREIKSRLLTGESHSSIASDFVITRELVSAINREKAWAWL